MFFAAVGENEKTRGEEFTRASRLSLRNTPETRQGLRRMIGRAPVVFFVILGSEDRMKLSLNGIMGGLFQPDAFLTASLAGGCLSQNAKTSADLSS